jgi:NADH-quinone oxidoreductase subunit E
MDLHNAICTKLHLPEGRDTTADMLFTVETVNCLGACGLAPAMVINDEVFGHVSAHKAGAIIDEIMRKEGVSEPGRARA